MKSGEIRLVETVTYEWQVRGEKASAVRVSERNFAMATAREWIVSGMAGDAPSGRFQMLNFLGLADIVFEHEGQELLIRLEFISPKIDYDEEYSAMTEEIADFCGQLLLSWNTPTSLRFEPDPVAKKRTKLEQFLFLRHFLNDKRFDACLEMILTQPHRELKKERGWVPSTEAGSVDFLRNPMALTRSWHREANGTVLPGEVCDVTKHDDLDTPPNRFVRFALEQFSEVCREVQLLFAGTEPPPQAFLEARGLAEKLEATLARPFFKDCGRLRRLPLESQVLQKKEGYRDILKSWLLLRSASALRWNGKQNCYTGTSRNVADLYEYWVFLTLHRILGDVPDVELVDGEDSPNQGCDPFLKLDGDEVKISLEKGNESRVRFLYRAGSEVEMCIHLYYERKFLKSGDFSWSGNFKPDYTLVMYPASFENEVEAVEAGRLSLLHFDAKYKAEKLAAVFGDWVKDPEAGESDTAANEEQRLFKQVDLLKMHTYNDAIKSTAGSYVLYPGLDDQPKPMQRYHEILPGVGAFVLKPGAKGGSNFLKQFLTDVFRNQSNQFTQYRYVNDATTSIVREKPSALSGADNYLISQPRAECVMLWLKPAHRELCREHGVAYCRAIYDEEDGKRRELQLDISAEIGSQFVPYRGERSGAMTTLGWRGKVTSVSFLTRRKLTDWFQARGLDQHFQPSDASHYLLFEFSEVIAMPEFEVPKAVLKRQSGSRFMALTCRWSELKGNPAD
ncbi:MAG: DUF2357 domain-containing protein [Verrucomicrobiales bacterium]|nr:DUF2357 domain-containing protein [Verrucomicrobiales bacterium]